MSWLAYIRVSTDMQAERGLSLDAQREAIRSFAAQHGWDIVAEFVDAGESAKTTDRPEFQAMISRARKDRAIEGIIVHKLDRFARNREDSITYKALLRREGVRVVSISEPVEDSPAGQALEGMLEVFAEFYSANLATEVKKGLAQAVKQGRPVFRTPVGYARLGKGQIAPDPVYAPTVRLAFELYVKGYGILAIAARLNASGLRHPGGDWTNSKVWYVLQNPAYAGMIRWNVMQQERDGTRIKRPEEDWLLYPGVFEPIIPMELWEETQAEIRRRRKHPNAATKYLLSGLLRCGECGGPMAIRRIKRARSTGRRIAVYHLAQCTASLSRRQCSSVQWSTNVIERALFEDMGKIAGGGDIDQASLVLAESKGMETEREGLTRLLTTLDERANRQLEAYEAGAITLERLKQGQERLQAETARARQRLDEMENAPEDASTEDLTRFRDMVAATLRVMQDPDISMEEKRRDLALIVESITLKKSQGTIRIRYRCPRRMS